MGKKTLYHPVSLHVIRGAAEYCGFQFGKIKQRWAVPETQQASYDLEIARMPGDLATSGTLLRIHHDLQECFMDDIEVSWVHMTQSGKWSCRLWVKLKRGDQDIEKLPVLPNPEPSIEPIYGGGGGGGGGQPDDMRSRPMLKRLREIVERNNYIVLDTETTGLKRPCEIIDIAIVDCSGVTLLNTLISPHDAISPFITSITGITQGMTYGFPNWTNVRPEVLDIIEGRDVLVYNATFDRHMMHCSDDMWSLPKREYKSESTNWFCIMECYAEYWGEWNEYHHSYRWQKLTDAMNQQGLFIQDAHRALGDVKMTMALIDHMIKP